MSWRGHGVAGAVKGAFKTWLPGHRAGRFDRPSEVDFIDGYGLGLLGEGHTLRYLDDASREALSGWGY